jgi:alginate export protein
VEGRIKVFAQLQSDFAPWRQMTTPVDVNSLDLEQAFIVFNQPIGNGLLKMRVGRQQFAFDLQRFISARDGPNIRQSFDAAWIDYELDPWRLIAFYSRPVQNQNLRPFDDYSSDQNTFTLGRVEHRWGEDAFVAAYYARFTQAGAKYLSATGNEYRNVFDVHFAATRGGFDFDFEGMAQTGNIGDKSIWAWALGTIGGYTFGDVTWKPRLGLQFDIASGNNDPKGNVLGTFNPLFPNGYYFALAGFTGYPNLIHLKPSVTFHPTSSTTLMLAVAAQWRQTTADAVYVQPNIPLPGTAGQPGSYTGTYAQLRFDWAIAPNLTFAVEAVHFGVSDVIRRAGGRDGDYVGVQFAFGW